MRRPAAAFTRPGSKYGHATQLTTFLLPPTHNQGPHDTSLSVIRHKKPLKVPLSPTQVDRESRGEKDSDQARGQPNSFDSQVRTCTPALALAPALAQAATTATQPQIPRSPPPSPPTSPQQDPDTTNLYVGNMSPNITEEFLYKQFCDFGPIQSVKVC